MVVEEGDEITRRVPVRAEDELLDLLAELVHVDHRRWGAEPLHRRRQDEKEGIIQGRVDTDQAVGVVAGGRVPTDEARDVLLGGAVEHLAERVEVLLADAQG